MNHIWYDFHFVRPNFTIFYDFFQYGIKYRFHPIIYRLICYISQKCSLFRIYSDVLAVHILVIDYQHYFFLMKVSEYLGRNLWFFKPFFVCIKRIFCLFKIILKTRNIIGCLRCILKRWRKLKERYDYKVFFLEYFVKDMVVWKKKVWTNTEVGIVKMQKNYMVMHGFFEREFILLLRIFFINSFYGHASIVKFFAHLVQFLFLFSLRLIIILLLLLLFFFSFIFLYLEHNISIISAAAMKHGEVCSIFTRFIKSIFSDSCSEVIIVDNVDIYIYI